MVNVVNFKPVKKRNWKKPVFRFSIYFLIALIGQFTIEAHASAAWQVPLAFILGYTCHLLDDILKDWLGD